MVSKDAVSQLGDVGQGVEVARREQQQRQQQSDRGQRHAHAAGIAYNANATVNGAGNAGVCERVRSHERRQ